MGRGGGTSIAADYPDRPVRVIVPSAPGGAPDLSTRIIATELTRQMGKQFIVDNRPGASGSIGTGMIARAAPDGYTIGNGTSLHLSGELLKRMTGTQMTHVPYKAAQQGITDMIGGQVHLMFDNSQSIGPHVRGGRVRGLAITAAKRSSAYPELPTVAESGVPNFAVTPFGGMVTPAGVSKAIVNRLNAEVNKALATSTVKEKFAAFGNEPAGGTPEEFAAFTKREVVKWAEVIKGAGIKAD